MNTVLPNRGNALAGFILLGALLWGIVSFFDSNEEPINNSLNNQANVYQSSNSYSEDDEYDPPVGFEGTDYMQACNSSTGSCYDLEIDSDGTNVERINFPNGGYRDVYYSDCAEGYCVVEDEDGNEWELSY